MHKKETPQACYKHASATPGIRTEIHTYHIACIRKTNPIELQYFIKPPRWCKMKNPRVIIDLQNANANPKLNI